MLCLPVRHQTLCNFCCPPFLTALPPARVKPGSAEISCPRWVKSGHMQCKRACPLYPHKRPRKRTPAKGHVCFTPESGHVRCKKECPLWAISVRTFAVQKGMPVLPPKADINAPKAVAA